MTMFGKSGSIPRRVTAVVSIRLSKDLVSVDAQHQQQALLSFRVGGVHSMAREILAQVDLLSSPMYLGSNASPT